MTFTSFAVLFERANRCEDKDDFMESGSDNLRDVHYSNLIWDLAHMSIRDARERLGLTRAEFSRLYLIPLRTLQNWELGVNIPPPHMMNMLYYCIFASIVDGETDGYNRKGERLMENMYMLEVSSAEFKSKKELVCDCVVSKRTDCFPRVIAKFSTQEEALDALQKYETEVRELRGSAGTYYHVTQYYVEIAMYDGEDGELIGGGDIVDFTPIPEKYNAENN